MSSAQFEHIQRVREDFREGSKRLKDSSNNSIKTLADDLYNKHTHFIFELIQNAADNAYEERGTYPPYISFQLTKSDPTHTHGSNGALIIQNNEIGFQRDNVDAICAVGVTTKEKGQGYIGEKGIGFKSVFRVTGNPHIFSNGYHFCLPEYDEETGLGYIVPQWIDSPPEDLDLSETHIILPLTKPDFGYEKIEQMLQDIEPETILFLSKLEEIRIETDTGDNLAILKDSTAMPEVAIIVEGSKKGLTFSNSDNFLVCTKRFDRPTEIHHEKRNRIEHRQVSVAFPLDEKSTATGKIFAYLPVRSDTGFPFLINADFILPSSREDIQDVPWNYWLMDCVASLVTSELLPLLKEKQLLGVNFLEVLANRLNNLVYDEDSLFYSIFRGFCEALKKDALLPTSDGEFVSAQNAALTRSDAVRNLITPAQLGILLRSHADRNVPLKWLSAEITLDRAPDLRRYLMEVLGIEEVTPDMFARRLTKEFLAGRTDEWLVQFYQFLSEQPALWRSNESVLRSKPILRLQDGTHVNPSQEGTVPTAYLSLAKSTDTSLPIVKWEITQDKSAYRFLKTLGVQECDIVAEVTEKVLPRYKHRMSPASINEHLQDFDKIQRAYNTDSIEKKEHLKIMLQEASFIRAEKDGNVYLEPKCLYFGDDTLRLYFANNPSCAFVDLAVYPPSAKLLFADLGILDSVRIQRKAKDWQGYVTIVNQHGNHKRGVDGFDPGIIVDGLEHALNNPTLEKSSFIWNHLAIPNVDCIQGFVEESTNQNYSNSSYKEIESYYFGSLLINTVWLPDSDGNMHTPSDITLDDLPTSFRKDEQLAKQLGMPISKTQMVDRVAPEIGVSSEILNGIVNASPETLQQIGALLQLGPDFGHLLPSPSSLFDGLSPTQTTTFPVSSVSNPVRRKERMLADLKEAPDQEYVEKVRSVRTTRSKIDPKTWLSAEYMNDEDQVICQICQEVMPFKYRGENYYFDAVEMLKGYFTKEYEAQFLALCPECSRKYRTFVKQVPAAMDTLKKQLMDSDDAGDFEVPLKLGGTDTSLRFVERHWLDIRAILSFYEDRTDPTTETSDSGEHQVEPKGLLPVQPDEKKKEKTPKPLPEAWENLLSGTSENSEFLIEAVQSETHRLCGNRPTYEQVLAFLKDFRKVDEATQNSDPEEKKEEKTPKPLPEAWENLLSGTSGDSEFLIEAVQSETEYLCGSRPTHKQIFDFLNALSKGTGIDPDLQTTVQKTRERPKAQRQQRQVDGNEVKPPSPDPRLRSRSRRKEKYTAYFQELIDQLPEQHNFTKARRAMKGQNYYSFASRSTGIRYVAGFNKQQTVYMRLRINFGDREKNKSFFDVLKEREAEITAQFDVPLYWERRDGDDVLRCHIDVYREGTIDSDASALEAFRAWHIENLLKFKAVFTPEIERARETMKSQ